MSDPNANQPVVTEGTAGAIPVDFGAAIIRTAVPYITAGVVAYLAERGLDADAAQVNAAVVTIGGSLWYTIVRVLEQKWPKAGWLLGSPKQPTYSKPGA
jgi:hypothetical protein